LETFQRYYGSKIFKKDRESYGVRIFMELLNGVTLSDVIKDYAPFTEKVVQGYSMQIVEGLHYLQQQNVSHL
jgi:serine/threonine protein kinase